jgi:hypothetical protein
MATALIVDLADGKLTENRTGKSQESKSAPDVSPSYPSRATSMVENPYSREGAADRAIVDGGDRSAKFLFLVQDVEWASALNTGNSRQNFAPPPGASATETSPRSARMMRRTMANPRPAPSRLLSPRQNLSKIFSRM